MLRDFDWPIMLEKLQDKGLSLAEIGRITGIAASTICSVKSEIKNAPAGWNEAIYLLDLYLKKTNEDVPRVGDHYEGYTDETCTVPDRSKNTASPLLAVA